jgi:transposase
MLQLTPQSKIFIAIQTIDGRKGINGLVATCRQKLNYEPLNGAMFVFRNKNKSTIKVKK